MRRIVLACICLFAALLLVSATLPAQAALSAAECLDLGFDKDVVRCSYCEPLFMVTQSSELQQECRSCCIASDADDADSNAKYASARIEGRSLRQALQPSSMNALAMFYRDYDKQPYFAHLSFKDKYSTYYPQIVLVDDDGKDAVTLRIVGWSPETLHEFLTKKIRVD